MALPLAFYGAAALAPSAGALAFRAASHPATMRVTNALASSASTVGTTISNGFGAAAAGTTAVYNWLRGEPAQADIGPQQTQEQVIGDQADLQTHPTCDANNPFG